MFELFFKLIAAIYLAKAYGQELSKKFEIIPFAHIGKTTFPNDTTLAGYTEFFLLVGTSWLLITAALTIIKFAITGGINRFSTTKFMRRIQGVTAEVFMVVLIVIISALILPVATSFYDAITEESELQKIKNEIEDAEEEWTSSGYKRIEWDFRENERRSMSRTGVSLPHPTLSSFSKRVKYCQSLSNKLSARTENCGHYKMFSEPYPFENPSLHKLVGFYREYEYLLKRKNELEHPVKPLKQRSNENDRTYWEQVSLKYNAHKGKLLLLALFLWGVNRFSFKEDFSNVYAKILRFFDEGRMGFGGSARFASMFEEWGRGYKKGALYMGRSLYNPFQEIGLKDDAHMLTVAASRGGKGATAIIPNLLLWEGSAVVIDPKGTNAHVTANARNDMGHDVYLIDPFKIATDKGASFDPFDGLDPNDDLVRERIASIADALVIPDDDAKDKHWDDGARTIICGLISHVLSTQATPRLYMIRDLINQLPEAQDRLWAEMSQNKKAGGYAMDAANRYIRGSDTNEMLGIMSNADKHTEWLSSTVMRRATSAATFKLSDLKKKPTTIYLIIPPRELERHNRLLRLFINLMIDTMEQGGRSKIPVLMIMDEFLALGKMPEIEDAFATMASYNLTLWPFVQELGKLKNMYGGSFNSFLANSRAVQVFGVSDPETTKYISERLGSRPLSTLGKIARSNENVALRTPDDIEKDISKDSGRQYIIEAGKPPLLLEKVPYYNSAPISLFGAKFWQYFSRFHGKYRMDPDHKK